jgi:formylglycine-generating enzyme required for sulfatase activity
MMAASPTRRRTILMSAVGGVAILVGAVLWSGRGPDLSYVPQMAAYQMTRGRVLYVQTHEVTISDWNRCNDAGRCALRLRPPVGVAGGDYPATGLNWVDANEYLVWINQQSRHDFRLPTVAEWSAIAANVMPDAPDPIFTDPSLTWASSYLIEGLGNRRLEPTGSYSVTTEGIADLDGNVWEWTQDCYNADRDIEPLIRCPAFHVMGEHDAVIPFLVRDPARGGCAVGSPPAHLGMRLVTDSALPTVKAR